MTEILELQALDPRQPEGIYRSLYSAQCAVDA